MGGCLLLAYGVTLAPGLTFWDAGEFVAAANGLGIPHPPGTPLFMALGRSAIIVLGASLGAAGAMNLLSALATATAGALAAWLIVRASGGRSDATWGGLAAAMCAGLMTSVWSNATEAEVYALSLLHAMSLLVCGWQAGASPASRGDRCVLLLVYLIALAPAVHLSVLVAAPAAIMLAARRDEGRWSLSRGAVLTGAVVASAAVGRMSWPLAALGVAIVVGGLVANRRRASVRAWALPLMVLGPTALLIMLVRARHDPAVNQGDPSTWSALADVVARRQYDVQGLLPRQAPAWWQVANVAQYADWQVAMSWGRGVFTSAPRVAATLAFVALAVVGARALRRDAPRLAGALLVLLGCGTLGVAAYLNLRAGASLGWGVLADATPHEARERDYFFVLGFWSWGLLAGYGALGVARRARWPAWCALLPVALLVAGNGPATNRSREPQASAPRVFAQSLLESAPRHAVLFVGGDNDSYPLWYLQHVEGVRRDVSMVTLPLLPATWYTREISRRTGLRWGEEHVVGARWRHEEVAARIARAAVAAGRPVAVSPTLAARERALLGSRWTLRGIAYVSADNASPVHETMLDGVAAAGWRLARASARDPRARAPDDVSAMMLGFLECTRLAVPQPVDVPGRDSLEVKCNLR